MKTLLALAICLFAQQIVFSQQKEKDRAKLPGEDAERMDCPD